MEFTTNNALDRRKKRAIDIGNVANEYGKIPPQALDLEEAVLGALMLEQNAINAVIDVLKPESFYKDAHKEIFSAIAELFQKTEPIDLLTVTNQLKKSGKLDIVGGAYYITQLTSRVASAANIEFHARIVSQKHIQRELIRISSETVREAFEDTSDVFELLDRAESNLFGIAENNIRKNYSSMAELIKQSIAQIEKAREQVDGVSGVPSGFLALDRMTAGWQKSDLIIVAARPAMGKTAFVLSMTRNIAVDFKKPVAVFSLEMSSVQLVNRLISSETEISADKLKKGTLEPYEMQQLNSKIGRLAEAPIFIDDTPAINIFELRAKCRRLKQQHNIEIIIIDYLQLMTAGGDGKGSGNREQEISMISRSLKGIAKELDVPIIALSQLSRAVETRGGDKKPQLSDLRESGAIEQDADMVTFIYRPEYYGLEVDEDNMPTKGVAKIIIAKHRNGAIGDVPLRFRGELAKFENLSSSEITDGFSSQIKPNEGFDNGPAPGITFSSRINNMEDDEAPF
jgi:replicative DNA helicase